MILVLVAGGRDFRDAAMVDRVLARLERDNGPIQIVHGACGVDALDIGPWSRFQGADGLAHDWATKRGREARASARALVAAWTLSGAAPERQHARDETRARARLPWRPRNHGHGRTISTRRRAGDSHPEGRQPMKNTDGMGRAELLWRIETLEAQKDAAYAERDRCVALITAAARRLGHAAGYAEHPAEDESWDPEWRTIIFVDLPGGQVSWHIHIRELEWFDGLDAYPTPWDGHTTETKYERVAETTREWLAAALAPPVSVSTFQKCGRCGAITGAGDAMEDYQCIPNKESCMASGIPYTDSLDPALHVWTLGAGVTCPCCANYHTCPKALPFASPAVKS